jgi:hypothetical protein
MLGFTSKHSPTTSFMKKYQQKSMKKFLNKAIRSVIESFDGQLNSLSTDEVSTQLISLDLHICTLFPRNTRTEY